ncbi:MAG: S66 peptidase family protein [Candidatus Adiutrix sp.]
MGVFSWQSGPLKWPSALTLGATIAMFAPAGPAPSQAVKLGQDIITAWGFKCRPLPKMPISHHKYLAAPDSDRAAAIKALLEDDSVAAIWAVRGGYGCQRLLPLLEKFWPTSPPKPIVGFSDLTALHLARLKAQGLVGFHGPVVTSLPNSSAISQNDIKMALLGQKKRGEWLFSPKNILKPGQGSGTILGGNLTLFNAALTGNWLIYGEQFILLLEDVGEVPYRLDRLLITLKQSPIWPKISALVFGRFTDITPSFKLKGLLSEIISDFSGPVVMNAPFGHGPHNRFFPLGAIASLDA